MPYLQQAITIAIEAGEILSRYFRSAVAAKITLKTDKSPVTQADIEANHFITEQLKKCDSSIPILTEENSIPDYSIRQQWKTYWLIDPLDGTRGFINHSPEFCVNIALIENHQPILGVIYSPVDKHCYYAAKNQGAYLLKNNEHQKIIVAKTAAKPLRFLCGHFDHRHPLKKTLQPIFKNAQITRMNSALKFGVIACGAADLYVRFGQTSEWDTAAGQCIVEEAGGIVVDFHGQPLQYNAKSSLINPAFIALGDVSQCDHYLKLVCDKII